MRRHCEIADWLKQRLAQELGLAVSEVRPDVDLASYGIDSVIAVEVAADLAKVLGAELPPTLLLDLRTIDEIARAAVARLSSNKD